MKLKDINIVKKIILENVNEYQPLKLGIFGSYARGDNLKPNDIDILFRFKKKISLLELIRLQEKLKKLLNLTVDMVSEKSITNDILRKEIMKDLILIENYEI